MRNPIKSIPALYIEILAAFVLIIIVAFIAQHQVERAGYLNSLKSETWQLKTLWGMMLTFRKGRYTPLGESFPVGNDPDVPNNGKLCCLYFEVNNKGEKITLVGVADAMADCRADGNTDAKVGEGFYIPSIQTKYGIKYMEPVTWESSEKAGYWVGLMKYYYDGTNTIPYDREFAKDHIAIVGFPSEYGSTGQATYIVNEKGIVYAKDLGKGEYIDTFPGPDPTAYGWVKLQ